MVWVIFWVGLAYVSAFAGDIWALVDPWRTIFAAVERVSKRVARRPRLRYPAVLGVWPASLLLLVFSWIELVYPSPAVPRHIAGFATVYTLLTWVGMALFGSRTWLQHGEVFTLVFGTLSRLAPTDISRREGVCALRPFGAGLLIDQPASASMTGFVLLLLSSVLYDGLLGTPEWATAEAAAVDLLSRSAGAAMAIRSIGLVGFWLLFLGAFTGVAGVMSRFAGGICSAREMARHLALTLVPIAIGYHLAHYLLVLLVQGQYVVPLISDPFGFGWNLFGTAGYRVDIAIVGARFAWYTAVTAILLGHIAAVTLAHLKVTRLLPGRALALRAEVPLTALMVAYTILSLSIIAEPIVERPVAGGSPNTPLVVPEDALIPEPGTGRLEVVGSGKPARLKLTYRLLGGAFHDGTKMSAPDLLYAYMFAWRWSGPGEQPVGQLEPRLLARSDCREASRSRLGAQRLGGNDKCRARHLVGGAPLDDRLGNDRQRETSVSDHQCRQRHFGAQCRAVLGKYARDLEMRQADREDVAEQDRGHRGVPGEACTDDRNVDPVPGGAEQVPAETERVGDQRHDVLPLDEQQQQVVGEMIADDDWHQGQGQVPGHFEG